ncbi:hypothetical protein PFICI_05118 [Pestalotiopsis fici W106-1]|uniref:Uncharacterized protein n=1 Tax=Pestalotiopsis fici (strain W106-1 / CGMCC3.15140) TaxID=1229662 RepID=W3XCW0_PESFW|nr:uncharacterized protein PFICI_05118 [Pestalotiopsis fici W106-1]ETS83242.1 hypothetical protein PFICI_05118 [Pestalotiopsis fici W106-1]
MGRSITEISTTSIELVGRLSFVAQVLQSGDTALITKTIREIPRYATKAGITSLNDAKAILLGGSSILHLAVRCAEVPVIEFVISHGPSYVDIKARDGNGHTPLDLAVRGRRRSVVQLLRPRMALRI